MGDYEMCEKFVRVYNRDIRCLREAGHTGRCNPDWKGEPQNYESWLKYWDKPETDWKALAKGMAIEFYKLKHGE